MKLNKNGWGTTEMFLLSGGLLIALLVAVFFISQLYRSFNGAIGSKQYINLELKLENAAKEYIIDNNINVNGEYKLSYETLKNNGYISNLEDDNGNECNGYVKITAENNLNYYNAYIKCDDYQTTNY